MSIYQVLIPKPETSTWIANGSGIVASIEGGVARIYFEGNTHLACNLHEVETRLLIAAGRLRDRYPTVAKTSLVEEDLQKHFIIVGLYDLDELHLSIDKQSERLWREWASSYQRDAA